MSCVCAPFATRNTRAYGTKMLVTWGQDVVNPNTPMKYGVRSIPTLLLFKGGEVVESTVGVTGKDQLAELLDKHIK